jgi:hypothetical protein
MKSHNKHKRRLRHRLIHKYKQQLKFFLYLAALVLLMIGNNFASFRSDDQPGQGNYTGGNSSPGDNKGTGGVQGGLTSIHPNTSLNPNLGIVKQLQTESTFPHPWSNIWGSGGQWEKFYIQSAMNLQHGGLRDWEDYLLTSLGSSMENHQNLGEGRSGSFFSHLNNEGGGGNPIGPMVGPPLEYPHSTNYGGGYDTASGGGSLASMSSGGSASGSDGPKTNNGPVEIPEPSTLILTAIGLLLLTRRVNRNRIQGVESRQRRERIRVTRSDEGSE